MKSFFIVFFSFAAAYAQQPLDLQYWDHHPPQVGDCRYLKPVGENLDETVLANEYCVEKLANSKKDLFQGDTDVPAKVIAWWSQEYLKAKYGSLHAAEQDEADTDMPALFELNILAAKTWEEILACTEGNADQARRQYFTKNFQCNKERVAQILLDLGALHQNLHQILQSGYFIVKNFGNRNPNPLPSMHPLFVQTLLEIWAMGLPGGDSAWSQKAWARELDKNPDKVTLVNNTLRAEYFIPSLACGPKGLWPMLSTSVFFHSAVIVQLAQQNSKTSVSEFDLRPNFMNPLGIFRYLNPMAILFDGAQTLINIINSFRSQAQYQDWVRITCPCGKIVFPRVYVDEGPFIIDSFRKMSEQYMKPDK